MQGAHELAFATTGIEDLSVPYQAEVNRLTGAATLRVPLPLSEGRSGFGPVLSLEYNATGGNSPFGLGWSLAGLPTISLDTQRALPHYDGQDGYAAGGSELVPLLERQPGGAW